MKIILIAGTRPNFMKIAPLLKVLESNDNKNYFDVKLVHTGQHYDPNMSEIFFQELAIRKPDFYLGVGSGTHAEMSGKIMMDLEKILLVEKPDLIVVVGDVDSTMASAISAKKLHIKVCHVEAGLRSYNEQMTEEWNRVITDHISNLLFVTEESGPKNLKKEGIKKNVYFVGNVMIDSLFNCLDRAKQKDTLQRLGLQEKKFIFWTMHRPETVDYKELLQKGMNILYEVQKKIKVVWPIHPRTKKRLQEFGIKTDFENVVFTEPFGYLDSVNLEFNALCILTDSGGMQEEASALNVPCLTMRPQTERPITVKLGTNIIVNLNKKLILKNLDLILTGKYPKMHSNIPLWDGKASERIVQILNGLKQ